MRRVGPGVDDEHGEAGNKDDSAAAVDIANTEQGSTEQDEAGQVDGAQCQVEPALAGE